MHDSSFGGGTEGSGIRAVYSRLLLPLCIATLMTGCANRDLLSLENGYEKTRLPLHVDRDEYENENYFSFAVNMRDQQDYSFVDKDTVPFRFVNGRYSADAAFVFEVGPTHLGIQMGLSPTDQGLLRFGGVLGFTKAVFPRLFVSGTTGLFVNNNRNNAKYEDTEWVLIFSETIEDSTSGNAPHLEIPLRVNWMFDTRTAVSPYASFSGNLIGIGIAKAGGQVLASEFAAGALIDLPAGHGFTFEGSASRDGVIGREAIWGETRTRTLYGARVAWVKKL